MPYWYGEALETDAVPGATREPMHSRVVTHHRFLVATALFTAVVLVIVAQSQMYDTNLHLLVEATSILAGDHPYRDFFEWGAPLAAYLSAGMQQLVGYRLIGEFTIHWLFMTAGVVLAFHLGLQLSRSIGSSLAVLAPTLVVVGFTPTYHYSKLFFFPAIVWLAWRYLERPEPLRAFTFGLISAVAFLFRHDYGMYSAVAAVAAVACARFPHLHTRHARSVLMDSAAYAAAVLVLVAPWLVVVEMSEGVIAYVQSRADNFQDPGGWVYATLLQVDPTETIRSWLRAPASAAAAENGAMVLRQIALIVPLLLLGSAARMIWRYRGRIDAVPIDAWRMGLAGAFLFVVASALYRQPSYVVVGLPLTSALAARYLASGPAVQRGVAVAFLAIAAVAAVMWTRESPLFHPTRIPERVSEAYTRLMASPPIPAESSGAPSPVLQYLRDCTAAGDRLLVTGSTPYQVNYFTRRPMAGGHLYWRWSWRSDPAREQESLALLQRQSVPFAFSTNDPVLDDFRVYPRIREYLSKHYVELPGADGRILVDRRRQPTGTFHSLGFPCFG
jgi:hypothetical protein